MTALADIWRGAVRYRLPLTPAAAYCLGMALLAQSADERRRWIKIGLSFDASLALWCVLLADPPAAGAPLVQSLADWLAPRLTTLEFSGDFAPVDAGPRAPAPTGPNLGPAQNIVVMETLLSESPPQESTASLPALLAHARAVALAGRLGQGSEADDARLLALLQRAAELLACCGTPAPPVAQAASELPDWLTQRLALLADRKPAPESIEARVREILALASVADSTPPPIAAQVPGGHHAAAEVGDRLHVLGQPDWSLLLPQLVRRLARLEQLETDFARAVEHTKLEALKEFAYGAGHEINNPLANISARAQTLLKDETDPDRRQKLAAINAQAFRAHEMIADLMLFARPPAMERERILLGPFLAQLAESWQAVAAGQQTAVRLPNPSVEWAVWGDRAALSVALRALVANALEALGRGGQIDIALRADHLDFPAGPTSSHPMPAVAIAISDTGPGIAAEVRERMFDPYFSGREAGRGLGFGLSKCWRIVTELGGRIDVDSDLGRETVFTLRLPASSG